MGAGYSVGRRRYSHPALLPPVPVPALALVAGRSRPGSPDRGPADLHPPGLWGIGLCQSGRPLGAGNSGGFALAGRPQTAGPGPGHSHDCLSLPVPPDLLDLPVHRRQSCLVYPLPSGLGPALAGPADLVRPPRLGPDPGPSGNPPPLADRPAGLAAAAARPGPGCQRRPAGRPGRGNAAAGPGYPGAAAALGPGAGQRLPLAAAAAGTAVPGRGPPDR